MPLLFTKQIRGDVKPSLTARCRSVFAHLKVRLPSGTPFVSRQQHEDAEEMTAASSEHSDRISHSVSKTSHISQICVYIYIYKYTLMSPLISVISPEIIIMAVFQKACSRQADHYDMIC